ncbi:FAD-dependent oxidoreductase [Mesorhizobium sp. NPDC059054]|uniref:FAD-dependent oxidoreductase n=1 Tax=Mesorhizobium sp. NPDC059054 TaxID=3346711 RepID=UPI0036B890F5
MSVLIVGGGPAGISAAAALAERGHSVTLVEQRDRLGGAIYRQAAAPGISLLSRRHEHNWAGLTRRLEAVAASVRICFRTVFIGIDDTGQVLLDDRATGHVRLVRPRALLFAVGAMEHIEPFEGWDLPGVVSAGGAQMILKETGRFMDGRALVAGSGPLSFAVAAQLAAANRPPLALLEQGTPWRSPWAGLQLLANPAAAFETLSYARLLVLSGVRYRTGVRVLKATARGNRLAVEVRGGQAKIRDYEVDTLVIGNGLRPNDVGLPRGSDLDGFPIAKAGDCREVLGADAAIADGAFAAERLDAVLKGERTASKEPRAVVRARKLQALLGTLTGSEPASIEDRTILCRCDGSRKADLDALGTGRSAFETRLVGRFCMGSCQGRFCRANVARLAGFDPVSLEGRGRGYPRWPIRPVSVAALCAAEIEEDPFQRRLETPD